MFLRGYSKASGANLNSSFTTKVSSAELGESFIWSFLTKVSSVGLGESIIWLISTRFVASCGAWMNIYFCSFLKWVHLELVSMRQGLRQSFSFPILLTFSLQIKNNDSNYFLDTSHSQLDRHRAENLVLLMVYTRLFKSQRGDILKVLFLQRYVAPAELGEFIHCGFILKCRSMVS